MAKHKTSRTKKQVTTEINLTGVDAARKAAHELTQSVQRALPCERFPLAQSACGCASVGQILLGLSGRVECPFDVPWDCPLRRTPTL